MSEKNADSLSNAIHTALANDPRINLNTSKVEIALFGRHVLLEGDVDDIISKRVVTTLAAPVLIQYLPT